MRSVIAVLLAVGCAASADSFLTSVNFACDVPPLTGPEEVAGHLDAGAISSTCAAAFLRDMNGYDCNGEVLSRLKAMAEAVHSPTVEFCLGFVEVYNSTYCDEGPAMAALGLAKLENAALSEFGDAGAWLVYGLALFQVDAFVMDAPWGEVTEMKSRGAQCVKYAERLASYRPRDPAFEATHSSALEYMAYYEGVMSAYGDAPAEKPERTPQGPRFTPAGPKGH